MAWAQGDGRNTVTGFAVLRTVGGEARTCAGLQAILIPDSPYARERMTAIFGNIAKGTRESMRGPVKFRGDDPLYVSLLRTTRCDGQGTFTFERVPDGAWYATTSVEWKADPRSLFSEGGSMMQRAIADPRVNARYMLARSVPTPRLDMPDADRQSTTWASG
jgi:hypothetical protein